MQVSRTLFLVALMLASTPALSKPWTGADWARACSSTKKGPLEACYLYTSGIMDGNAATAAELARQDIVRTLGPGQVNAKTLIPRLQRKLGYCGTDPFPLTALVPVILEFLKTRPDYQNRTAGMLVNDALKDKYPCER